MALLTPEIVYRPPHEVGQHGRIAEIERRHPTRLLFLIPMVVLLPAFLPVAVALEPGLGRFLASVGMLLLVALAFAAARGTSRLWRVSTRVLCAVGLVAYAVTLFV